MLNEKEKGAVLRGLMSNERSQHGQWSSPLLLLECPGLSGAVCLRCMRQLPSLELLASTFWLLVLSGTRERVAGSWERPGRCDGEERTLNRFLSRTLAGVASGVSNMAAAAPDDLGATGVLLNGLRVDEARTGVNGGL